MNKKWWFSAIIILGLIHHILWASSTDIQSFVETNFNKMMTLISDTTVSDNVKQEGVYKLTSQFIDFKLITKLSVGPNHWDNLSKQKRAHLTRSFTRYLQTFYTERLLDYSNEKVTFQKPTRKKNKALLPMLIQHGDITYQLIYKLYYKNKKWMVYDMEVNGVSIIKTYRIQFDSYLSKNKLDELIKTLQ